jgi:PPK2 family polyphosphate:nucleotide phosphotransferase
MHKRHRVEPGQRVRLRNIAADDIGTYTSREDAEKDLARDLERMFELQNRLYAENRRAVLVILQGMDAAGKDGTISHVFRGLNPQGVQVAVFGAPSTEELRHDYLWRIHRAVPRHGNIGIFNRSHYEDVLAVRVRALVPKSIWSRRFEQINEFERMLSETGTTILKFYLHVSKREQRKRLGERLHDPNKNWKFAQSDIDDRALWRDYVDAYEDVLERCSTEWAPWHIVPADHKWYRNLVVARTIVKTLADMAPKIPRPKIDVSKVRLD